MKHALLSNLNGLAVIVGFTNLVIGIAAEWSTPVAAIVAGVLLMTAGMWPYLAVTLNGMRRPRP